MRIQTQARARAARAKREQHRQRHAARVGSIRSSGRAAAEDLRALSRPGTAAASAAPAAGGDDKGEGAGAEEGLPVGDTLSVLDGAAEALLPITLGAMSMGSMGSPESAAAAAAGSRSFSLPQAIEVAAVRTPSSVGSPASIAAAATAVDVVTASIEGAEAGAVGSRDGAGAASDDGERIAWVMGAASRGSSTLSPLGNRRASGMAGAPLQRSNSTAGPVRRSRSPSGAR